MAREIIDSIWFNDIGIVATRNDMGQVKFYIGKGNGINEIDDNLKIASCGTRVIPDYIKKFFDKCTK